MKKSDLYSSWFYLKLTLNIEFLIVFKRLKFGSCSSNKWFTDKSKDANEIGISHSSDGQMDQKVKDRLQSIFYIIMFSVVLELFCHTFILLFLYSLFKVIICKIRVVGKDIIEFYNTKQGNVVCKSVKVTFTFFRIG